MRERIEWGRNCRGIALATLLAVGATVAGENTHGSFNSKFPCAISGSSVGEYPYKIAKGQ